MLLKHIIKLQVKTWAWNKYKFLYLHDSVFKLPEASYLRQKYSSPKSPANGQRLDMGH